MYARIDLPRPGEDFRTRWQRDSRGLVQRLAALLLEPALYADLLMLLPAHSASEIVDDFRKTAAAARSLGLRAEAEGLLRAASAKAGLAHDRPLQVGALQDLQVVYADAGKPRQAAAVAARLHALERPRRRPAQERGALIGQPRLAHSLMPPCT